MFIISNRKIFSLNIAVLLVIGGHDEPGTAEGFIVSKNGIDKLEAVQGLPYYFKH